MPFSAPPFHKKKHKKQKNFFLIINININIEVQVIFTLLLKVIGILILITLLKKILLPFCSQYVWNSCIFTVLFQYSKAAEM